MILCSSSKLDNVYHSRFLFLKNTFKLGLSKNSRVHLARPLNSTNVKQLTETPSSTYWFSGYPNLFVISQILGEIILDTGSDGLLLNLNNMIKQTKISVLRSFLSSIYLMCNKGVYIPCVIQFKLLNNALCRCHRVLIRPIKC